MKQMQKHAKQLKSLRGVFKDSSMMLVTSLSPSPEDAIFPLLHAAWWSFVYPPALLLMALHIHDAF